MKTTIVLLVSGFFCFTGFSVKAQGYSYPEPTPAFKIPGPGGIVDEAAGTSSAHFQQQHQQVNTQNVHFAAPAPGPFPTQQNDVSFNVQFSGENQQPESLTLLVPVQQHQAKPFAAPAPALASHGQEQYGSSSKAQSTQIFSSATAQQHSLGFAPAPAAQPAPVHDPAIQQTFSSSSFQGSAQDGSGQQTYSNVDKAQAVVSNSFEQSQAKLVFDQPAPVAVTQQQNTFSTNNAFNTAQVVREHQGGAQNQQGFAAHSQVQQQHQFHIPGPAATAQSFEENRAQNRYGGSGKAQSSFAVQTPQTFSNEHAPQSAVTINKPFGGQQVSVGPSQSIASAEKSQVSQQVSFNAAVGGTAQQGSQSSGAKLNYGGSGSAQSSGVVFNQGGYSSTGSSFASASASSSSQQQFAPATSASYTPPPPPTASSLAQVSFPQAAPPQLPQPVGPPVQSSSQQQYGSATSTLYSPPPAVASPPLIPPPQAALPEILPQPAGPPAPPSFIPGPGVPPGQLIRPPGQAVRPSPAPVPAPFPPSPVPAPRPPAPTPVPFPPAPAPAASPVPFPPAPTPVPFPVRPWSQGSAQSQGEQVNEGDYSAIPGEPGADYPIFSSIPPTDFTCSSQQFPGYYADVSTRCQVFHVCWDNRQWSFLCPNGTIFSQEHFVCVWWNDFDCEQAPGLHNKNKELYAVPQPSQQSPSQLQSTQGVGSQGLGAGATQQLSPSLGIQQAYQNQGVQSSFTSSAGSVASQQVNGPSLAPAHQINVPVPTLATAPVVAAVPSPAPASGGYQNQNQAVHSSVAYTSGNVFTQQTNSLSLGSVSSPQVQPVVSNTHGTFNLGQQYLPPASQQGGNQNAGKSVQQQQQGTLILAQKPSLSATEVASSLASGGSFGGDQVNGQNLFQRAPATTPVVAATPALAPASGGYQNQAGHNSVVSTSGNLFTQLTNSPSFGLVSSPQEQPVLSNTQGTFNLGQQYLPPAAQQDGIYNAGKPVQQQHQQQLGAPVILPQEPLLAATGAAFSPVAGGSFGGAQVNNQNLFQQTLAVTSPPVSSPPTTAYLPPSSGGVKY